MNNEDFLKSLEIEQQAQDYTPLVYSRDAISASAEVGEYSTAMDSVKTYMNKSKLNTGAKIAADELNRMYPFMEEPFKVELSPDYAVYLADRQTSKMRYQNIKAHGDQNFAHQLAYFGAGMYSHVTDPLEFGAGMLGGWAVSAAVGTSAIAGTGIGAFLARSPIAAGLVGDVVGNLAIEPLMALGAKEAGDTYTMSDFVLSTVAAPIGMSVGKYGASKALKGLRYAGGRALEKAFQTTTMQVAMGKQVDLANIRDAAVAGMDNGNSFVYKPQDIGKMKDGVLYMAGDDFKSHGNVAGLDVDGAVHLTDNPNRASGLSIGEGNNGRLTEVNIKDLNIMDGAKEFEPSFKSEIDSFLKKNEIEGEGKTAKDVIDLIDDKAKSDADGVRLTREFTDIIKNDGFDGLSLKQDILEGGTSKSADANSLTVFDTAVGKLSKRKSITVEKSAKAIADQRIAEQREMARVESQDSGIFHDEGIAAEYDAREAAFNKGADKMNEPVKDSDFDADGVNFDVNNRTKELQMETENSLSKLKELEDEGSLTSEVTELRDDIITTRENIELEAEITKASIACMR